MLSDKEFDFMVNSLSYEIIMMISEERGIGYLDAADIFYQSNLPGLIGNPKTALYYQSPGYVYSFLQR